MDKDIVMQRLSDKTGADIKFNDMGLARLRFDRKYIVDFELSDDEKAVYIYSSLGHIPDNKKGCDLLQEMMRAHFLGRDSDNICFALDNDTAMAFVRYEFASADDYELYTVLEDFLDCVSLWTDKVKNCQ